MRVQAEGPVLNLLTTSAPCRGFDRVMWRLEAMAMCGRRVRSWQPQVDDDAVAGTGGAGAGESPGGGANGGGSSAVVGNARARTKAASEREASQEPMFHAASSA